MDSGKIFYESLKILSKTSFSVGKLLFLVPYNRNVEYRLPSVFSCRTASAGQGRTDNDLGRCQTAKEGSGGVKRIFKKIGYTLALLAFTAVFLYSALSLLRYLGAAWRNRTRLALLEKAVVQQVTELADRLPLSRGSDEAEDPEDAAPTAALPRIDFDRLQSLCPAAVAWLYGPDSQIDFPVVQAADNSYYLDRAFDGRRNPNGAIFMDYRNRADLSDRNTVLYGHNMKNGAMFGTLKAYREQAYYDAHPVLYLFSPQGNYQVCLFAGGLVPADSPLYETDGSEEARRRALDALVEASVFRGASLPEEEDRLLTLSTCDYAYDGARFVLIGKLVLLEEP